MLTDIEKFGFLIQHSKGFRCEVEATLKRKGMLLDDLISVAKSFQVALLLPSETNKNGNSADVYGIEFTLVDGFALEIEQNNKFRISQYDASKNIKGKTPCAFGNKDLCYFKADFLKKLKKVQVPGVYCWVFDNQIVYIGECENFYKRMTGYGNISYSARFEQSTNCKMNSAILQQALNKGEQTIKLFFYQTNRHKDVEQYLLQDCGINPEYNQKNAKNKNMP